MSLEKSYKQGKKKLLNDRAICKENRGLFAEFFVWEEEKLKRINDLPEIDDSSYKTLYGYLNRFRNVNKWFKNKPWKNLTLAEINCIYKDLEDGKIKNSLGKRFEDRRSYYNKVFKSKPFKLAGKQEEVEKALEFFTDRKKKEVRFVNEENFKKETVRYLDMFLEGLQDDDFVFPFGYRQAVKILDSAAKRSNAKCEPNNEKPTWKDLRSGMACHLFSQGWHSDDINLRLGHTISSRELDVYLNYMAQNRNRAKKVMYNNNLEDIKNDLEEARQREKQHSNRLERQKEDIEQQRIKILKLESAMKDKVKFDDIAQNLFENEKVKEALLQVMLKKGFGKQLMELAGK